MSCKTTVTMYAVSPYDKRTTVVYGVQPDTITLYAVTPVYGVIMYGVDEDYPKPYKWYPCPPEPDNTEEEIKKLKERIQKLEEILKLKKQLKEKEEELQKDKLGYSITVSGSTTWTTVNTDEDETK